MRKPRVKLAQILPAARYLPKLPIEPAWAAALTDLVLKAMIANGLVDKAALELGEEPLASLFVPSRAQRAAEFYVSAKRNETSLPSFRRMVDRKKKGSLAAAVVTLNDWLQDGNNPPFPQMEALFSTSDPTVDGLDQSLGIIEEPEATQHEEDGVYDDDSNELGGIWREKYSPQIVKAALAEWLPLLDELHRRAGGGSAPGRSPIEAEITFVSMLAASWNGELDLPLSSGRGTPADENTHDEQGSFSEYVRKAAEIIPADLRPHSWDHAIRTNIAKKT
jgi:hypothetical protein